MDPKARLIAFEREADKFASELSIIKLPLRVVLTHIYGLIDNLYNGSRIVKYSEPSLPRPTTGFDVASRLGYLLPLLQGCDASLVGESGLDAAQAIDPILHLPELMYLTAYGHLHEIMPQVHRGHFVVEETETGFRLNHPSLAFSESETRDLIMTELSLPFYYKTRIDDKVLSKQAWMSITQKRFDPILLTMYVAQQFYFLYNSTTETRFLSDEGFYQSTGATFDEFQRFRAAWAAVANYCNGMSNVVARIARDAQRAGDDAFVDKALGELYEWTAPVMKAEFLAGLVVNIGGISHAAFDILMKIFSINPKQGAISHAGDGYLPPIVILGNCYMFNPDVLRSMLSGRNIFYVLNRLDQNRFSTSISEHLEPALISSAIKILQVLPSIKIYPNVKWAHGEMDILVYSDMANVALHFQAKAAIPAQGSRMLISMENRVSEGLAQLARFRSLSAIERDQIISDKIQRKISNVRVIDVILSRANFGTNSVWSRMGDVIPVNLTLLNGAVQSVLTNHEQHKENILNSVMEEAKNILQKIIKNAYQGWEYRSVEIGEKMIEFLAPIFDEKRIDSIRDAIYPREH